jgi:nucleotide-binding universal stress UspA family protein
MVTSRHASFFEENIMLSIKTILHPTDFSEHSECAFRMACMLARGYDASLIVLHVAAPPVIVYGQGVLPAAPEEHQAKLREQLQQLIAKEPTVRAEHRLAQGDAAAEILRVAQETKCDMIVMGTHGRTGLSRLVMGSVAERVVRSALCPVVTVKAPLLETGAVEASAEELAGPIAATTKA